MPIIKRIILPKNASSKSEIFEALNRRRAEDKKLKNGIYYPNGYLKPCEGCGKAENFEPVEYFGQMFCKDCVQKWLPPQIELAE